MSLILLFCAPQFFLFIIIIVIFFKRLTLIIYLHILSCLFFKFVIVCWYVRVCYGIIATIVDFFIFFWLYTHSLTCLYILYFFKNKNLIGALLPPSGVETHPTHDPTAALTKNWTRKKDSAYYIQK